jgi:hypothetical protein
MADQVCYYSHGPTCDCRCQDADGSEYEVNNQPYVGSDSIATGNSAECCHRTCIAACGFSKAGRPQQSGLYAGATGFKRRRVGGTGQPARFANQSGSDKGKILGLTTAQALIALGVGVAAYFIIKKVK